MQTKEKLELGWKYLSTVLLFVLGVMFIRSTDNNPMKSLPFNNQDDMVFIMDKNVDPNIDELASSRKELEFISSPFTVTFITVSPLTTSF